MVATLSRVFSRTQRNTLVYLSVSVLSKTAAIFLIPLYTSRLTRAEYASYGLCQTLYWIVPTLLTLSLHAAFGRFFFDHRDPIERDGTLGVLARTIVGLTVASGLLVELVFLLAPNIRVANMDVPLLRLVLWTCVAIPVVDIVTVYLRCSESALRFAVLNLSVFAITICAIAYFVTRGLGLRGLLLGMMYGQLVGALFASTFIFLKLKPIRRDGLVLSALRYSIPFIPHMIGTSLMGGVDRWVLEYNGLRDELGLYTLAVQLTAPVTMMAAAWNDASSPRLVAAFRDGGVRAVRAQLRKVALGFVLSTAVTLAGTVALLPLLARVVGPRFLAALPLVPLIGLAIVAGSTWQAFINVLSLPKNTRVIPLLTLTTVIGNVAFNAVLVPRFGLYGAVLGTALAVIARALLLARFAFALLRSLEDAEGAPASTAASITLPKASAPASDPGTSAD